MKVKIGLRQLSHFLKYNCTQIFSFYIVNNYKMISEGSLKNLILYTYKGLHHVNTVLSHLSDVLVNS